MSTDNYNFRLLTLAREARGITQTDLAKSTNTDQGNLSKIEQGLIHPTEELITKYANELNFPESFFYQAENKTPISDFFYRKRVSLPAKDKIRLEAQIDLLRMIYEKLLKSVEIPLAKLPSSTLSKNFLSADAAILAREFYRVSRGPIKELVSLIEKNGIALIFIDVKSDKFDGMTVYTDSNYPLIILNKNMSNDRKRFTIAHELGHQILHLPYRFDIDLYERIATNANALEMEADAFASEFLLPSTECRVELYDLNYHKLSDLKLYWKVSKRALVYKAKTLGCIDERKYKNLMIELSRRGERTTESFDVELDEPKLFGQILRVYKTELNYSQKELSDYLCISETDLTRVTNLASSSKLKIAI